MTVVTLSPAPAPVSPPALGSAPLERLRRRLTGLSIQARLPEILLVAGRFSC